MTADPSPRLVLRPTATYQPSSGMTRALAAVLLALARCKTRSDLAGAHALAVGRESESGRRQAGERAPGGSVDSHERSA